LWTIFLGLLSTVILLISAPWVARIAGMSLQYLMKDRTFKWWSSQESSVLMNEWIDLLLSWEWEWVSYCCCRSEFLKRVWVLPPFPSLVHMLSLLWCFPSCYDDQDGSHQNVNPSVLHF
jgi:hypothetical protein